MGRASWARVCLIALAAFVAGVVAAPPALATGGWAWPLEGEVVAAYGSRYDNAQGTACTHGGVDIGAPAGSTVRACAAGEVVFCGLVPAGEGERSFAVSVLTGDGLRVTYLPLVRARVSKGDVVAEGEALGESAGSGDPSSTDPHLHLGVRRGEARLDPLGFLGAPVVAPHPEPSAGPVPDGTGTPSRSAPAPARVPAKAPAPAKAPVHVQVPAHALTPAPAPAPAPLGALPGMPVLRRIPAVATPTRVRTGQVATDVGAVRDVAGALLARLALVGIAGACLWPLARGLVRHRASGSPATVQARRD